MMKAHANVGWVCFGKAKNLAGTQGLIRLGRVGLYSLLPGALVDVGDRGR